MKLEEKITLLRKRNGWSQEELGFRLDVSRQAVSKWEMGDSVPDLDKIIKMSEVFGCTTDYLLKGDGEGKLAETEPVDGEENAKAPRQVRDEEGERYLALIKKQSWKIAVGVMGFILSPIPLFILLACASAGIMPENAAIAGGVVTLIAVCAAGVVCVILGGVPIGKYEYLEKEELVLSERLKTSLGERKQEWNPRFTTVIAVGVALCILSVVPLLIVVFCAPENGALKMASIAFILAMVAIAVFLFVKFGMVEGAYQRLLQEGDFAVRTKRERESKAAQIFHSIYWPLIVATYLTVSFLTGRWDLTWLIWPISAAIFAVLSQIFAIVGQDKK